MTRNLNQDPLENLFGAVRSLGCVNPTCGSFISSYKTLMLNNLVSPHSLGANCEEDLTDGSLTNYKNLFSFDNNEICKPPTLAVNLPKPGISSIINTTTENLRQLTNSYIAGFIIKKLNREILKDCKKCLKKMCTDEILTENELITVREYQSTRLNLKYPGVSFRILIDNIITYINNILPSISHHQNIQYTLVHNIKLYFDLSNICCLEHTDIFKDKIVKCITNLFIKHWCAEVNKILSGKREMRIEEKDQVKILANVWHKSHSKKKNIQGKYNQV